MPDGPTAGHGNSSTSRNGHATDPEASQTLIAVARPTAKELAIRAEGVSYWFGEGDTRAQVLFDNSLEIGRGEVVIMTGPSGSGKTTLLTLVGALRRMQQGCMTVLGRNVSRLDERGAVELRKDIGFIFQSHNLFSSLSAMENVRMATALKGGTVREMNDRSAGLLEQIGLGERLDHLPAQLSGGQRQRVAIARALVNGPALVLADEPTAALDAESGQIVLSLLRKLADGMERTTVLIVTHDQRVIDHADRVVSMMGGRIINNSMTRMAVRITRALAQSEILKGLSEATLTKIANVMTVEERKKGETIVCEGEPGDRFYLIGSGVAEMTRGGEYQDELYFGEGFGRITAFSGRPLENTVRAKTDMELYVLAEPDFRRILESDQTFESRVRALLMALNTPQ
ncbi:MAG: ABC transporter ATP-binding protein [Isosphaeraceae bacterium]